MKSTMRYLVELESDQKRLRREFDDRRIHYGRNQKNHQLEVWYTPDTSMPYKIALPENVSHAIILLQKRQEIDKMRARDVIRSIDDHNDKLMTNIQADAMAAVRSGLQSVACGRKFFT